MHIVDKYTGNLILYDLETTGSRLLSLDDHRHKIIQMSAVVYGTGEAFDEFVSCTDYIPSISRQCHNIRNSSLASALSMRAVLLRFTFWLDTMCPNDEIIHLVAHNGSDFDEVLLHNACITQNVQLPARVVFHDSLISARERYPTLAEYGHTSRAPYTLGNLYKQFLGRPIENAHDALYDVYALSELMPYLVITPQGLYAPEHKKLASDQPVTVIRGLGHTRALRIAETLGLTAGKVPTTGQVAQALSRKTPRDVELLFRKTLGITSDALVIRLSRLFCVPVHITQSLFLLFDLEPVTVERLAVHGVRSDCQLLVMWYYDCAENAYYYKALMQRWGLPDMEIAYIWTRITVDQVHKRIR